MIRKNQDEFQFLGPIEPEEILAKICSDEIQNNPLRSFSLLGIFYGYGEKNSQTFEREANLMQALSSKMAPPFSCVKIESKLLPEARALLEPLAKRRKFGAPHSDPAQNDIKLLNQLASRRKTFNLGEEPFFLNQISSPSFAVWDEEEVKQLIDSYTKTRSHIKEIYQTGSFLEKTLQQWISPQ